MSKRLAPCGHEGEPIIGAYVRCALGCPADPKRPETYSREATARQGRRGEYGHVDFCACRPCIIRRRGAKFIIGSKGGKSAEVPWDGLADHATFPSPTTDPSDRLRFWRIVDDEGAVLADGFVDVYVQPGQTVRIDVLSMLPAKLAVSTPVSYDLLQTYIPYAKHLAETTNGPGAEHYNLREIAKGIDTNWSDLVRGIPFQRLPGETDAQLRARLKKPFKGGPL